MQKAMTVISCTQVSSCHWSKCRAYTCANQAQTAKVLYSLESKTMLESSSESSAFPGTCPAGSTLNTRTLIPGVTCADLSVPVGLNPSVCVDVGGGTCCCGSGKRIPTSLLLRGDFAWHQEHLKACCSACQEAGQRAACHLSTEHRLQGLPHYTDMLYPKLAGGFLMLLPHPLTFPCRKCSDSSWPTHPRWPLSSHKHCREISIKSAY